MSARIERSELRNLLLDHLRANPRTQVGNILQFGIEEKIGRSLSESESQLAIEMLHELTVSNIIMPASDRHNTGWPWFAVTSHGRELLSQAGPPVYDYDGYMVELSKTVPNLDSLVVRYVGESLRAFQANLYLASMAMLGCASERAITLLIESYVGAIDGDANQAKLRQRISGRDVSSAYERFRESFVSVRRQINAPDLIRDLDDHIGGMFAFIRLLRNAIVHPSALPNITNALVYANLQYFAYYVSTIFGLILYFEHNKVTV